MDITKIENWPFWNVKWKGSDSQTAALLLNYWNKNLFHGLEDRGYGFGYSFFPVYFTDNELVDSFHEYSQETYEEK